MLSVRQPYSLYFHYDIEIWKVLNSEIHVYVFDRRAHKWSGDEVNRKEIESGRAGESGRERECEITRGEGDRDREARETEERSDEIMNGICRAVIVADMQFCPSCVSICRYEFGHRSALTERSRLVVHMLSAAAAAAAARSRCRHVRVSLRLGFAFRRRSSSSSSSDRMRRPYRSKANTTRSAGWFIKISGSDHHELQLRRVHLGGREPSARRLPTGAPPNSDFPSGRLLFSTLSPKSLFD